MAFILEADYSFQIRNEIKGVIAGAESNALSKAELAAQAEMESYLNNRYDVATEFAKTDDERNPVLVMYLIDMALYHLHSKQPGRNIPQIRIDRYDTAIDWLSKVAKGDLNPNLAEKTGDEVPNYQVRVGGNEKTSKGW
jgi:phage gp36-like protein